VAGLPGAHTPRLTRRSPLRGRTQGGAPAPRDDATIRVTVDVMPPSAPAQWRLMMRKHIAAPREVSKVLPH